MATIKNILRHVTLETAERKRRCHHKRAHAITKGMVCLVVVNERGSKSNYCSACAQPMLRLVTRQIRTFATGLSIEETLLNDESDSDAEMTRAAR
ncbi:MAG TPA: hypothetical protein VGM88_19755 [Kofleriaceae bacterium]|jgi:hypothetical protein